MVSTLRAHGPLPVNRVLTDCGARMRAPYGASPLVVPVPEKLRVKMRKTGTRKWRRCLHFQIARIKTLSEQQ